MRKKINKKNQTRWKITSCVCVCVSVCIVSACARDDRVCVCARVSSVYGTLWREEKNEIIKPSIDKYIYIYVVIYYYE